MPTFPSFSELHIISDLHMGGDTPGRQIFKQETELDTLVNLLLQQQYLLQPQGLVINGDLVDFLAQPHATYFDAQNAETQLGAITKAFPAAWEARRTHSQARRFCLCGTCLTKITAHERVYRDAHDKTA